MKRVLIFSLAYYPKYIGGAEVAIKEITDRISDIEFHMVTLRFDSSLPKVEKIGNILVHRIGFSKKNPTMADLKAFPLHYNKAFFQFTAAIKALSLHSQYHYDGVWAMMAHATGIPAALFKLVKPHIPFILTLQEGDSPQQIEKQMRPLWFFFSRAFTSATIVQAISTFLGRWARARGFKGPLEIIPNAVDTKQFSYEYSVEELSQLKKTLRGKETDVYLITTSRLVHKNAIDDVLRALALLPPSIHFLVLGDGPDKKKLKQQAEQQGVGERVIWLDHVTHQDLPKYLHMADIFIRPSRSEGMGNSFIEAMAAGIPVIATQEGGITDFLFDAIRNPDSPTTGWAVDTNVPQQIAQAVKSILDNPEQVKKVTTTARALAFEKYDWNLIAADMQKKVFQRVL